ncbi:MAG: ABC transporter substrate-binding protein, partial [Chloroflexota bacterium]|nr:ABC transporter substrate-binding protein [Chloroflexota bacterium]
MKRGWPDAFVACRRLRLPGATARVLLGLALVAMASCAPNHAESGRRSPGGVAGPPGPVARVGAALSLTGSGQLFGAAQRSGIRLAQDEINAGHQLGNTKLEVLIEDDGSDRDQASAVFQGFIENGQVVAIIGPTLSDTALTVDPLAQQAGVPVLAISNAASGITQIGNAIFRDCLTERQLAPQIIKMVRSHLKIHTAALLHSDTDPNRAGSHTFKKALQDAGIRIATEQVFTPDQTDFSSQLDEIGATRPDAVFITSPASLAASILVQARQRGLSNVPIIGNSSFNSDTVLRNAGTAAEGLIVGSAWSAANPSPRNQQFIQSYRARYGVDPDQLAAQAYTGVFILAAALRDAGTV